MEKKIILPVNLWLLTNEITENIKASKKMMLRGDDIKKVVGILESNAENLEYIIQKFENSRNYSMYCDVNEDTLSALFPEYAISDSETETIWSIYELKNNSDMMPKYHNYILKNALAILTNLGVQFN